MERYVIREKVGSGNFAKVYLATDVYTKEEVAVKLVNKRELKNNKAINRVRTEIANMKQLGGHHNVVSLHDSFETSRQFGLIMEYVPGGELFDYVQRQGGMSEVQGREMFRSILEGVRHCHKHGVAHRDLKLENILLTKENKPKIADFGFSNSISPQPIYSSSVGSLLYSSPEIVQGKPYQGPECDVWSLGVILYTMLTATMPFDDSNMGEFLVKIETGDYPTPPGISDVARDLISRMLNPNPINRYTLTDILAHPWMAASPKKPATPSTLPRRRVGMCYGDSNSIRNMLIELNECNCPCHKEELKIHGHRDSVITKHCQDCSEVQANDPEVILTRQVLLSRNSSISSGYGSEMGSQYLQTPSPVSSDERQRMLGFGGGVVYPTIGGRLSVPRKSSGTGVSGRRPRSGYQRCSMPAPTNILREGKGVSEEDDIVFV